MKDWLKLGKVRDFFKSINYADEGKRLLALIPVPQLHNLLHREYLLEHIDPVYYTREEVIRATNHYIRPEGQSVIPARYEHLHEVYTVRIDLFKELDRILENDTAYRHTVILADSDMGKSSFSLNYYDYHHINLTKFRRFKLALFPLGIPNIDIFIKKVNDKANTVVILDTFDEDVKAIQDPSNRLSHLLELTCEFRHVIITSRTQFYFREKDGSHDTGMFHYTSIINGFK